MVVFAAFLQTFLILALKFSYFLCAGKAAQSTNRKHFLHFAFKILNLFTIDDYIQF
jgi:hypothetical protein